MEAEFVNRGSKAMNTNTVLLPVLRYTVPQMDLKMMLIHSKASDFYMQYRDSP